MSCNSNWRIAKLVALGARQPSGRGVHGGGVGAAAGNGAIIARRRRGVLAALLAWPLALPLASLPAIASPDAALGLKRWGSGEFRRFGFFVYAATLWAGDDPLQPPLALRLDYERDIAGSAIAEASVKEMRRLGVGEDALQRWAVQMARVFPDVKAGDWILGLYTAGGASFMHNGRRIGDIAEPEFARRFFGIWLDPRTSAPELRTALLRRPGS